MGSQCIETLRILRLCSGYSGSAQDAQALLRLCSGSLRLCSGLLRLCSGLLRLCSSMLTLSSG